MTRLILWNVNGLRSAYSKGLADYVAREKPDILCLQEIKVQEDQLSPALLSFNGEYQYVLASAEKKGYAGVATFVRNGLKALSHSRFLGLEEFDIEGRFIKTTFEDFDLYNIYFPSGTSGEVRQSFKYKFLETVLQHFERLDPVLRSRAVVCGDFNICHREIDIHHPAKASRLKLTGFLPEERAWIDRFIATGFADSFRLIHGDLKDQYTWWSYRANARAKNLGWRIDYFFVARALSPHVTSAEIDSAAGGSDHCPISLELCFPAAET